MKIENLNSEHLQLLLNTPHQVYLVDDILKLNVTAFKSEITFGNINPAGVVQTAVSFTLSTQDLYRIAKNIIEAIENKKNDIVEQQSLFVTEINN